MHRRIQEAHPCQKEEKMPSFYGSVPLRKWRAYAAAQYG